MSGAVIYHTGFLAIDRRGDEDLDRRATLLMNRAKRGEAVLTPAPAFFRAFRVRRRGQAMTSAEIVGLRGRAQGYDRPLSYTFMVGNRRVTLTFDLNRAKPLQATWAPNFPRRLLKRELTQYKAGRRVLIGYIADMIGGTVMVVDA
jgi:hypothetical protein